MKKFKTKININDIVEQSKGQFIERFATSLDNVAELDEANNKSLCFYENEAYLQNAQKTKAGLLIVPKNFSDNANLKANLLKVDQPYFIFMVIIKLWLEMDKLSRENVISKLAVISDSASIGKNVSIGNFVVIEDDVVIGNNTIIESNCVIKKATMIGNNCHFMPNCTIYDHMIIGNYVTLHAGVVIGADGFGYMPYNGIQEKVPQVGNVVIKDYVEIGANSCIDRGTLGSTLVDEHTKIDNLVQVGHNDRIGKNTILCSQVGVAGSTSIGDWVYLAGQVGVADHVKVGNKVKVGAQSGIHKNVSDEATLFGSPARDARLAMKISGIQGKLPEMYKTYIKNKSKKEL